MLIYFPLCMYMHRLSLLYIYIYISMYPLEALKTHGTGLIEARRIDAAKDIAEGLAKSPNVMYESFNI